MSRRRLVLMIEDDPDIRELFAERLRRAGSDVVTATTGQEGLERARELRPDLVIVDIGLPDVDGWRVIDALAADEITCDIPVLIASIADPSQSPPTSVQAHLVKPIKKGALEAAVLAATLGAVD